MITQTELKRLFFYNKDTGVFNRRVAVSGNTKAGDISGTVRGGGYLGIKINRKQYSVHRLAFLYVTGSMPEAVDHIDHDRKNNKWLNLRAANTKINNKNQSIRKDNTSGHQGVRWEEDRKKWLARIYVDSICINLGRYKNIEDAVNAKKEANIKYGFHENHGKNYDTNS